MNKKIIYLLALVFSCILLIGFHFMFLYFDKNETYDSQSFIRYLSLSSSIILLILIFSSKLNLLLERQNFLAFPIKYITFLLYKLKHFIFNRYFIFVLLLYITYLFSGKIDFHTGLLYFFCTLFQYLFTILLYFILWDILSINKLNKHINVLFFLSFFPTIFIEDSFNYKYLLFNPVTTSFSLPVYLFQEGNEIFIISFLIIPLLFILLYLFLIKKVKQWV